MGDDVYFRCGKCGERALNYDGRNYRHTEEIDPPTMRMVLELRKKEAGCQMCDACWREFSERRSVCSSRKTGSAAAG